MNPPPKMLIVTVGNDFRGDDGAAIALYRCIRGRTAIPALNGGMAPENIIGEIADIGPGAVLIVDTMDFGGKPGELTLVPPGNLDNVTVSTHGSLSLFVRCLDMLCEVDSLILGIQPGSMRMGEGLSSAVEASVVRLGGLLSSLSPDTGIGSIECMVRDHFDPAELQIIPERK